jgi:cell volume regulation protein A
LDVTIAFLILGATIFVGFAANFLFRKYGAPDVLILIILGFLIGPGGLAIVDPSMIDSINVLTPYVAAIALAIIMFDAGLDLKVGQVFGAFGRAVLQTVLAFLMSMIVVGLLGVAFLGWSASVALVLGAILGGTSGAIVIPLVKKLRLSEKTKIVLTLESALTDVLVIVVATSMLVLVADTSGGFAPALSSLALDFLVSIAVGFVAGLLWLMALRRLAGSPFSYIVTVGVLVTAYAATDVLAGQGGAGAVAALVFGLMLGNKESLAKMLRQSKDRFRLDDRIRDFNSEITFFVRTFFFVYLGIVASTIAFTLDSVSFAILVFVGLLAVRLVVAWLERSSLVLSRTDAMAYWVLMPRGLSAAVLASVPLTSHVVPEDVGLMILGTTVVVILITTVLASFGAFYIERVIRRREVGLHRAPSGGRPGGAKPTYPSLREKDWK